MSASVTRDANLFLVQLTAELGDEESESDAHGGDERGFALLGREHEDDEDDEGGEEHLNEDALCDGGSVCEGCDDGDGAREHARVERCGDDARQQLGREKEQATHGRKIARDDECEEDLGGARVVLVVLVDG